MNKKGFTLIELIVVMIIIGIGAAFFAPNISSFLPNYRLRSAAREITSAMRTAQIKAVSSNLTHRVRFTKSPATYILQYRDTQNNWKDDGPTKNLPKGIQITTITFPLTSPNYDANFNPNSTASSGEIRLVNSKGSMKQIRVSPTNGRVTIN